MENLKNEKIDLMMIDDERDILELSEMALKRQTDNLNIEITTDPDEVLEQLESCKIDAILSDYNMPQMSGLELLEEVRDIDEDLPFIFYTGEGTEKVAKEAINAGVTNYFKKEAGLDHYDFILNSIENAVDKYRDMERAEVLSVLVESSNQPVIVTDTDSSIVYVNKALEEVSGYQEAELLCENPSIFNSGSHTKEEFQRMYDALNNGETVIIEGMKNETKDGEIYTHDQELIPISVHNGTPDYFVGISELRI